MGVNLQGAFNVTHAFVEQLRPRARHRQPVLHRRLWLRHLDRRLRGVQGGVRSFTEVLARDLAPHGVRVNAVAPGLMETDMTAGQRAQDHGTDWYMRRAPMARRPRRRDRRPGPVPGLGHGQLCERRGATPAAAGAPKASPGKALVTGGASGIGLAIVERLARDGYAVVMADRNGELAAREAAALRAQGLDVEHRVVDLADEAATRALARELAPGRAGQQRRAVRRAQVLRRVQRRLPPHVRGEPAGRGDADAGSRARHGAGRQDREHRLARLPGREEPSHYVASKAALVAIPRLGHGAGAARHPGQCDRARPDRHAAAAQPVARAAGRAAGAPAHGRAGQPQDIANAVSFLAAPHMDFITGQVIFVDGGKSLGGSGA